MSSFTFTCKIIGATNAAPIFVTLPSTATVADLREYLVSQDLFEGDDFHLLLRGRPARLQPHQTLQEVGISSSSTVNVVRIRANNNADNDNVTNDSTNTDATSTATSSPRSNPMYGVIPQDVSALQNPRVQSIETNGTTSLVTSGMVPVQGIPPPPRWYPDQIYTQIMNAWIPETGEYQGVVHKLPFSSQVRQVSALGSSDIEYRSVGFGDESHEPLTNDGQQQQDEQQQQNTVGSGSTSTEPMNLDRPPATIPDNISSYAYTLQLYITQLEQALPLIRSVRDRIAQEETITSVEDISALRFDARRLGSFFRRLGTATIDLGSSLNHIDFGEPIPEHYVGSLAPNPPPGTSHPSNWTAPTLPTDGDSTQFVEPRTTTPQDGPVVPTPPPQNITRPTRRRASTLRGPQVLHQTQSSTVMPMMAGLMGGLPAGMMAGLPPGMMAGLPPGLMAGLPPGMMGMLGMAPPQGAPRRRRRQVAANNAAEGEDGPRRRTTTRRATAAAGDDGSAAAQLDGVETNVSTEEIPLLERPVDVPANLMPVTVPPSQDEIVLVPNPLPHIPERVAVSLPPDYLSVLGHQPVGVPQPNYFTAPTSGARTNNTTTTAAATSDPAAATVASENVQNDTNQADVVVGEENNTMNDDDNEDENSVPSQQNETVVQVHSMAFSFDPSTGGLAPIGGSNNVGDLPPEIVAMLQSVTGGAGVNIQTNNNTDNTTNNDNSTDMGDNDDNNNIDAVNDNDNEDVVEITTPAAASIHISSTSTSSTSTTRSGTTRRSTSTSTSTSRSGTTRRTNRNRQQQQNPFGNVFSALGPMINGIMGGLNTGNAGARNSTNNNNAATGGIDLNGILGNLGNMFGGVNISAMEIDGDDDGDDGNNGNAPNLNNMMGSIFQSMSGAMGNAGNGGLGAIFADLTSNLQNMNNNNNNDNNNEQANTASQGEDFDRYTTEDELPDMFQALANTMTTNQQFISLLTSTFLPLFLSSTAPSSSSFSPSQLNQFRRPLQQQLLRDLRSMKRFYHMNPMIDTIVQATPYPLFESDIEFALELSLYTDRTVATLLPLLINVDSLRRARQIVNRNNNITIDDDNDLTYPVTAPIIELIRSCQGEAGVEDSALTPEDAQSVKIDHFLVLALHNMFGPTLTEIVSYCIGLVRYGAYSDTDSVVPTAMNDGATTTTTTTTTTTNTNNTDSSNEVTIMSLNNTIPPRRLLWTQLESQQFLHRQQADENGALQYLSLSINDPPFISLQQQSDITNGSNNDQFGTSFLGYCQVLLHHLYQTLFHSFTINESTTTTTVITQDENDKVVPPAIVLYNIIYALISFVQKSLQQIPAMAAMATMLTTNINLDSDSTLYQWFMSVVQHGQNIDMEQQMVYYNLIRQRLGPNIEEEILATLSTSTTPTNTVPSTVLTVQEHDEIAKLERDNYIEQQRTWVEMFRGYEEMLLNLRANQEEETRRQNNNDDNENTTTNNNNNTTQSSSPTAFNINQLDSNNALTTEEREQFETSLRNAQTYLATVETNNTDDQTVSNEYKAIFDNGSK